MAAVLHRAACWALCDNFSVVPWWACSQLTIAKAYARDPDAITTGSKLERAAFSRSALSEIDKVMSFNP